MSERRNLIGAWLEYEKLRKGVEEKAEEAEITKFNLTYGARTEAEIRAKWREIRILVDKIETLIGPPEKEPANLA
jgi:hypothetical protein